MAYQPWTFEDMAAARERRRAAFNEARAERAMRTRDRRATTPLARLDDLFAPPAPLPAPAAPQPEQKGGGGGLLGGLWGKATGIADAVTPDALEGPAKGLFAGALTALDAPARYAGRPAFGALSGLTEAERRYDPETGRYYRETASFADMGRGILDAFTQDPRRTYREGSQAAEEYLADPNKSRFHSIAGQGATDPLSFLGPGAVRAGMRFLPAAARANRGARLAGGLLENPGAAAAGGILGAAGAGQAAEAAGLPEGAQVPAMLAGGLLGGVAGARWRAGGIKGFNEDVATMQGRRGKDPTFGFATEKIDADDPRAGGFRGPAGNETTAFGTRDPNRRFRFRWRVAEADDLTPSNLDTGDINPRFPQRLQPRNRATPESKSQVEKIGRELSPAALIEDARALDRGAPIVGPEGVVESGNGRVMGLRLAMESHPEQYKAYVREVMERAESLGLNADEIAEMSRPVLVRERIEALDDAGRLEFVKEANERPTADMTMTERAFQEKDAIHDADFRDFAVVGDEKVRDALNASRNRGFVQHFLSRLTDEERRAITEGGQLTQQGADRIAAAMFARTFPTDSGKRLLTLLYQSTDETVQNAKQAIEGMLPRLAKVEAGIRSGGVDPGYSIADDLAAAVTKLNELRAQGTKVEHFLAQSSMFVDDDLSQVAKAFLSMIDANKRSSKKIRDILGKYVDFVEQQPPPGQAGMFGDATMKSREELLVSAIRAVRGADAVEQADFLRTDVKFGASPRTEFDAPEFDAPERPPDREALGQDPSREVFTDRPANADDTGPTFRRPAPEISGQPGDDFAGTPPPPQQEAPPPPRGEQAPPRQENMREKARQQRQQAPPRQKPPPLDETDDWTVLGLEPGRSYSIGEVQSAYRQQIARYHPDVAGMEFTGASQRINAAWDRWKKGIPQRGPARGSQPPPGAGPRTNQQPPPGSGPRASQPPPGGGPQAGQRQNQPPPGSGANSNPPPGSPPPGGGGAPPRQAPPRSAPRQQARAGTGDLFKTQRRGDTIHEHDRYSQSWRGKVDQAVRRAASKMGGEHLDPNLVMDRVVHPFKQEMNRIRNLRNHWVDSEIEQIRAAAEKAGLHVEATPNGWRLTNLPGAPAFEDVIERATAAGDAAWQSLTPEQRQVMDSIREANQWANDTIAFHGGKLHLDPEIDGDYFPRVVLDKNGRPKAVGVTPNSRTMGSTQSHNRGRTWESMEEGIRNGLNYENPWEALRVGLQGKLRTAEDAYMANMLSPLAHSGAKPPFGYRTLNRHPAFGSKAFPAEVADRIEAILQGRGENVFTKVPTSINAVLTPLRAGFDLSATLQQGMAFLTRHPKEAGRFWVEVVGSLKNPERYHNLLRELDSAGPGVSELTRDGLHFVAEGTGDEMLFPNISRKLSGGRLDELPVLGKLARGSNQHFGRLLNVQRIHMANHLHGRLVAQGLTGRDLTEQMQAGINAINRMTGWTGRKPTTLEQVAVFAPRYTSATIEQLAAALTKGNIEGAMARQHLGLLLAEMTMVTMAWNRANGHSTEFDPRDSNFLRLRDVGGLDVSPLGSYDVLFRSLAGTLAGQKGDSLNPLQSLDPGRAGSFAEAKLSPAVKTLWESVLNQETYDGRPLDTFGSPEGFAESVRTQVESSIPFAAQNLIKEGPIAAAVGATGASANPVTAAENRDFRRDKVSREIFQGRSYDELEGHEKSRVNEDAQVAKYDQQVTEQSIARSGDAGRAKEATRQAKEELAGAAAMLAAGQDQQGNPYSGSDFRRAYHDITQRRIGAFSTLKSVRGDAEISGYFDLYDEAKRPDGTLDYDKLEQAQAVYVAAHPGVLEKVERTIGATDDATMREFRAAQKEAAEYYAIPAYRGMTKIESERAGDVIREANALVSYGLARDRQQAIRMLSERYGADVRMLARRALRRGSNRERKRFREEHELFAKYYSGISDIERY